jgi:cytochrome b561
MMQNEASLEHHTRYDSAAVLLHWLIGLLLLAQLVLGWWMLDLPKSPPGLRAGWFNLHKSIGITLGLLIVIRIIWRLRRTAPALPKSLPKWQQSIAHVSHIGLYVCMVVMPLSGLLGALFSKYPIIFFGITLPKLGGDWPAAKSAMSDIHNATSWLFVTLLALHILAALWHLLQRDGLFLRMWPIQRHR